VVLKGSKRVGVGREGKIWPLSCSDVNNLFLCLCLLIMFRLFVTTFVYLLFRPLRPFVRTDIITTISHEWLDETYRE